MRMMYIMISLISDFCVELKQDVRPNDYALTSLTAADAIQPKTVTQPMFNKRTMHMSDQRIHTKILIFALPAMDVNFAY